MLKRLGRAIADYDIGEQEFEKGPFRGGGGGLHEKSAEIAAMAVEGLEKAANDGEEDEERRRERIEVEG